MFMDTNIDIDLGVYLVEKKSITPSQLKDAREWHKLKKGYLSQGLIELGFITDASLTTFLTCQYGYSYLPLKAYNIDDSALKTIPAQVVSDYLVFPIEKNDKLLTVTMADPLNKGVVEMLRQITSCEIIVFISTRSEIQEAIAKYYGTVPAAQAQDRFHDDPSLRDDLIIPYVSNGLYSGPNRRRYRRFAAGIDIDCYLYPNILKARSANVSMSGLLFESNLLLPKGMQMAIRMRLSNTRDIMGVVEVTRSESKRVVSKGFNDAGSTYTVFEIGVFFNFLSTDDQNALSQLLRTKISR